MLSQDDPVFLRHEASYVCAAQAVGIMLALVAQVFI
ncbi:protein of unknown function (plasmid) [Cupriavidus taiwanensis]|uniref:Uncharacterized protein n=1 Tax=Cupriavidus taiwanensis TaxID=164546 RepID=A0A375FKW2_9BURK|nr:protein of unknown function [Cupriavidus taiwanensis]SOZ72016.1 protein of unknown function [Cupriavidus taiwanensis]SOZ74362.1 protein of unknown function [Cupriavidus taiwanensis]SPA03268.1 protein of unknown function [Cupriavidus taiwanensis]SPA57209.1 protein of unknown function [Cupriavidus taiwanensis]